MGRGISWWLGKDKVKVEIKEEIEIEIEYRI